MGTSNHCGCKRLHALIITDGNRRWADLRGKTIAESYLKGSQVGLEMVRHSLRLGFSDLTAFVLSSNNLARPEEQIRAVLDAVIFFIGEIAQMPSVALHVFGQTINDKQFNKVNARKVDNPELTVHLAVNYSWQADWDFALKAVQEHGFDLVSDRPQNFLGSAQVPDVDLVIRTGNHHSLSGMIIPQIAQAEIYFSNVLWPDYTVGDYDTAVEWFYRQKRQLGM